MSSLPIPEYGYGMWWQLDKAFIVGSKQDGKFYYYLSESAGVNGEPRIVSQKYLGSAE